ncbi:MAG: hypothetical protein DWQ04_20280 [Chloroflexi bacterium]|nr:MAG: hypothetical protein DWQ04_20280 [Chloroflexota bacterium]
MQYDLVFEGGGAKGVVFVGALEAFEAAGHTFGRLIGTSAGAITATLLAVGYTSKEMLPKLEETRDGKPVFTTFMGKPPDVSIDEVRDGEIRKLLHYLNLPLVPDFIEEKVDDRLALSLANHQQFRHLYSFVEQGGWFSAQAFVNWLQNQLDAGTHNGKPRRYSQMTMHQFYESTNTDLTLTGADITDNRLLIFNYKTAPDLPVVWAVRMSMSVPLLWQEVIWQKEWGLYQGKSLENHAVVDGGLLSNFPIELLLSNEPQVTALMGAKHNEQVLGLLIDEDAIVPHAPPSREEPVMAILGRLHTVKRIRGLIDTATMARDKMVIEAFKDLVVRLPAKGYGTTEFGMSDERREALINGGRQAMKAYLERPISKSLDLPNLEEAYRQADRIAIDIVTR